MVLETKPPKKRVIRVSRFRPPPAKDVAIFFGLLLLVLVWYSGVIDKIRHINLCYDTCKDAGPHACTCCGIEHPIIIAAEDDIKLGQHSFTEDEIKLLHILDEEMSPKDQTTY